MSYTQPNPFALGCRPQRDTSEDDEPADDGLGQSGLGDAAWRLGLLKEVAEFTMALTRRAAANAEQAMAEPDERETNIRRPDPVARFTGLARAVRQTLALHARFEAELRGLKAAASPREPMPTDRFDRVTAQLRRRYNAPARRALLENTLRDVIDEQIESRAEARRLAAQLCERLDDASEEDECETDFADMPIGVALARLAEPLGLKIDWSRWANEYWAVEEALAGIEGSPYPLPGDEGLSAKVMYERAWEAHRRGGGPYSRFTLRVDLGPIPP